MNSSAANPGGPPRGQQFDNRRIAAGLIDVLLVALVAAVIMFAAGVLGDGGTEMTGALQLVVLAWALFYYFAMESGAGQTVGKRLMGLRVLTVDGQRAGYREIGMRTVLRIIDGIGVYLVGLIAMLATGQRRQRLGDLAAKTCVTSADWQPASGSVGGAGVAVAEASVPSTAIVLPTAPEPTGTAFETPESAVPAGPEVAAVPSPFTPFEEPPVVEAPVVEAAAPPAFVIEEPPVVEAPVVEAAAPPAFVIEEPPVVEEVPVVEEPPVVEAAVAPVDPIDAAVDGPADGPWELPVPAEPDRPEPVDEEDGEPGERIRVRTVETLSAMDQLMSEMEEDEHAGRRSTG